MVGIVRGGLELSIKEEMYEGIWEGVMEDVVKRCAVLLDLALMAGDAVMTSEDSVLMSHIELIDSYIWRQERVVAWYILGVMGKSYAVSRLVINAAELREIDRRCLLKERSSQIV